MKVTFKKRRYYKSKLREPGETVEMDRKHARAFIRVNAAVPAVTQAKPKTQEPPKRTKQTEQSEVEEIEEVAVETLPEEDVQVEEEEKEPALEDLSYRELQERCRQKELPASGTKAELIGRLEEEGE